MKDFEPPPAGTLELASLVVAIVPTAEGLVVRVDSSRSDDPHDLAYASLVIQRLVMANRDGCEIDGHRKNPMRLWLARRSPFK